VRSGARGGWGLAHGGDAGSIAGTGRAPPPRGALIQPIAPSGRSFNDDASAYVVLGGRRRSPHAARTPLGEWQSEHQSRWPILREPCWLAAASCCGLPTRPCCSFAIWGSRLGGRPAPTGFPFRSKHPPPGRLGRFRATSCESLGHNMLVLDAVARDVGVASPGSQIHNRRQPSLRCRGLPHRPLPEDPRKGRAAPGVGDQLSGEKNSRPLAACVCGPPVVYLAQSAGVFAFGNGPWGKGSPPRAFPAQLPAAPSAVRATSQRRQSAPRVGGAVLPLAARGSIAIRPASVDQLLGGDCPLTVVVFSPVGAPVPPWSSPRWWEVLRPRPHWLNSARWPRITYGP